MSSRDDPEKSYNVPLPDNNYVTVYLRDSMTNEEFLASACIRKNLNPMEHFVRVKKRREMEDHNYFVPHRNDLIETYVSHKLMCSSTFKFNLSPLPSCTLMRSSKCVPKYCTKSNYKDQHLSRCGDSQSKPSSLRTLIVRMNCVVMSVVSKTKVLPYRMVRVRIMFKWNEQR